MVRFQAMREAFPDYAPETLPAIPHDWKDISWRCDLCPSFETPCGRFQVFIDYLDRADREYDIARFCVTDLLTRESKLCTESWNVVLHFLDKSSDISLGH